MGGGFKGGGWYNQSSGGWKWSGGKTGPQEVSESVPPADLRPDQDQQSMMDAGERDPKRQRTDAGPQDWGKGGGGGKGWSGKGGDAWANSKSGKYDSGKGGWRGPKGGDGKACKGADTPDWMLKTNNATEWAPNDKGNAPTNTSKGDPGNADPQQPSDTWGAPGTEQEDRCCHSPCRRKRKLVSD